jgi:Xaa-Pro aminopeptidase
MFQSFEASTDPTQGPPRLAALRREMAAAGLDGFLVPRADAHQGEYVADCDARLAWLTGFTGSAGFCAVLAQSAGLFVDGRYRVQARAQVAKDFTVVHWPETRLAGWLREALPQGGRVGFDPWLHSRTEIEQLTQALGASGIELAAVDNLVDAIWPDRPAPPAQPIEIFPEAIAGRSADEKREAIGETLRRAGQSAAVLTLPDSICWLLNIRGTDIARNPVVQANAVVHANGTVQLFVSPERLTPDLRRHLGASVHAAAPETFPAALSALAGKVRIDPASAPAAVADIAARAGLEIDWQEDPTVLPKARKTPQEIAATTEAHLRDGAAMVEFLTWLDAEAPKGGLTEIDVVRKLEGFRRATNALRDVSFETICGAGPHGAIVHYRVTEASNREVRPGELLLVDSGGQYLDGTTDITRTIALGGAPSEEERACFTRVLKGMIAISRARWPKGRAGRDLDALARISLWQAGLDYDHGTGHGVGVYLSVHEGPQRLSRVSEVPLEPGMILSNEPGYYREGAFGIRLENLVVVQEAPSLPGGDDREMLDFATLTHVPIDRRLVDPSLLDAAERAWLNDYHAGIAPRLGERLSPEARAWLEAAAAPV